MDISEIINEIKQNKLFKDTLIAARNISRSILDKYFSDIPYTRKRKEWELEFFLEDIEFLTKKWILEIIWELDTYKGSNFNELKRNIKQISSRSLSIRLKELENYGIISRTVENTHPPKVLYTLSEKGKGFVELMVFVIFFLKQLYD